MEDSLHLVAVKYDPLDLAALVFVVEGNGLPGGCAEQQRLHKPETASFTCFHRPAFVLTVPTPLRILYFLKLIKNGARLRLTVTPVSGL